MADGGEWTPVYRSDRWARERDAFDRWRSAPARRVWSPRRRRRFQRWLVEYRAHQADRLYRQLADERRERLAHSTSPRPITRVSRCTFSFEVADSPGGDRPDVVDGAA